MYSPHRQRLEQQIRFVSWYANMVENKGTMNEEYLRSFEDVEHVMRLLSNVNWRSSNELKNAAERMRNRLKDIK
jgi:hypothetical protein